MFWSSYNKKWSHKSKFPGPCNRRFSYNCMVLRGINRWQYLNSLGTGPVLQGCRWLETSWRSFDVTVIWQKPMFKCTQNDRKYDLSVRFYTKGMVFQTLEAVLINNEWRPGTRAHPTATEVAQRCWDINPWYVRFFNEKTSYVSIFYYFSAVRLRR